VNTAFAALRISPAKTRMSPAEQLLQDNATPSASNRKESFQLSLAALAALELMENFLSITTAAK